MKNLSNKEANKVTKECLQTALIQLMSQKPFEKITITELVRRSGVSRTAFYRNYESKEEILNEVCRSFIDSLSASFVAFRAKCKIFSRHLQKPILKTEKGRFKGL